MLQGVAALKLKENLYFLNSLHTQSNELIFWLWTQSVTHKNWMKYCPVRQFVSRTTFASHMTFNPNECISANIAITVTFNLNINHVYIYNRFSKTCYCKYLVV